MWIEVYIGRDRRPASTAAPSTLRADGRTAPRADRARGVRLRAARREQHARDGVLRAASRSSSIRGAISTRAYHRFAHRHRIELVHAYDEQTRAGRCGPVLGRRLHAGPRLRRARRGRGQHDRAARSSTGRASAFDDRARRLGAARRVDDVPARAKLPRALTFLYMPDEPSPPRVSADPDAGGQHALEPGTRPRAADLRDQLVRRAARRRDRHLVRRPAGFDVERVAARARQGRQLLVLQRRPAGRRRDHHRRAGHRRAGHDVGRVQARRRRSTSTGTSIHWRHNSQKQGERKQNVWAEHDHVRQPRPARKPIDDQGYINGDGVLIYPGEEKLHPEEDRGVPGRSRPSSSPTFAAACRTIST